MLGSAGLRLLQIICKRLILTQRLIQHRAQIAILIIQSANLRTVGIIYLLLPTAFFEAITYAKKCVHINSNTRWQAKLARRSSRSTQIKIKQPTVIQVKTIQETDTSAHHYIIAWVANYTNMYVRHSIIYAVRIIAAKLRCPVPQHVNVRIIMPFGNLGLTIICFCVRQITSCPTDTTRYIWVKPLGSSYFAYSTNGIIGLIATRRCSRGGCRTITMSHSIE